MLVRFLAAILLSVVLLGPPATAIAVQDASPVASALVLPPDAEVAGLSQEEWSARWWQWFLSFPEAINPYFDDSGVRCGYGQSGPVFFLHAAPGNADRSCTVPVGVFILIPLGGAECSTADMPPDFGITEAELTTCVSKHEIPIEEIALTIDGYPVADLSAYLVTSPLFSLTLAEDNLFEIRPGVADMVARGYQVMLAPPAIGEHVIVVTGPGEDGPTTLTYRLTVAANLFADAVATPES